MQTLNISGIDVLTFYDSGANNNLVNNRVALEAGFRLLSRNVIRFGVAGGGTTAVSTRPYWGPTGTATTTTSNARG
jgi:hypothetical protein